MEQRPFEGFLDLKLLCKQMVMDKRVTGIPRVKAWKTNSDQHMAALDEWSIGPYKVLKTFLP